MILQSFRMAFSAITSNKMRSFLTMLGIIIGIMAVVVLVSIVDSATDSVMGDLEVLGADKISVTVFDARNKPLSLQELDDFTAETDSVAFAAPTIGGTSTIKAGDTSTMAQVMGVTNAYMPVEQLAIDAGRFIKTPDTENNSNVCVLGPDIAEDLFGTTQALGKTAYIDGHSFVVVGLLEDAGSSLIGSSNDSILIPYTVAQRMFHVKGVNSFTLKAADSQLVGEAEDATNTMLMKKYRDEDSFNVFNQSVILDSMDSITNTMALMMGGIGGISLLVGGIGIMNIMLVSVAERTREIGIRKAIGASKRRILMQFLIEALVLSVVGGVIGIGVSWVMLQLVSAVMNFTYTMTPGVVVLAVVFSMAIGLVFGLHPANKAAKLAPIEALRTE